MMGRGGSGKRRASSGSRKPRSSGNPSSDDGSVFSDGHLAVTLSGGGVRSAAVSSGVLCFLKEVGVIDKVSLLSCVSGGGYTGGALVNWWRKKAQAREQADGTARGMSLNWMYVFFDVIVNGPNPLGSWNTPWLFVRDTVMAMVVTVKAFRNWLLTGLPDAVFMAHAAAYLVGPHLSAQGATPAFLRVVLPTAAVAVVSAVVQRAVFACTPTERHAKVAGFSAAARAAAYCAICFLFCLLVLWGSLALEGLHHRDTTFLVVIAVAALVSRATSHCGGVAMAAATSLLVWVLVSGRLAADIVLVQAAHDAHAEHVVDSLASHPALWQWVLFASAAFSILWRPMEAKDQAFSTPNYYRYNIARAYFPLSSSASRCSRFPWRYFMCTPYVDNSGYEDPPMAALRYAEEHLGVPRLVASATANTWKRLVNVDVSATTQDAGGTTTVRRRWDLGYAPLALDSHGFSRIDEGCRALRPVSREAIGVAHATGAVNLPPATWEYPQRPPGELLALSSALAASAGAVSSEMGRGNANWRAVASVAQTGMTMGRWVDLASTHATFTGYLRSLCGLWYLGWVAMFVPALLSPFYPFQWLGVATFFAGVLFTMSTPWHHHVEGLATFEPSRELRQRLEQEWWQPPQPLDTNQPAAVPAAQYLSDGGHTENLGLLPALQRRCRRIVCLDAGQDPKEQSADLLLLMGLARRFFGCQFLPAPAFSSRYPDVTLYVHDQLLIAKPVAFHLRVLYPPATAGDVPTMGHIMYLHPRYRPTPAPAITANTRSAHERARAAYDAAAREDNTCKAEHYEYTHQVLDDAADVAAGDAELVGCCCDCCSRRSRCGWTAWLGRFPQITTSNQFLNPRQRRGLHRVGFECMNAAWEQHPGFFAPLRPDGGSDSSGGEGGGHGGSPGFDVPTPRRSTRLRRRVARG